MVACVGFLFLTLAMSMTAQVSVNFSQERTLYLQYEPVNVTLTLTNVTDSPLVLEEATGGSWLNFLVFGQDGAMIGSVQSIESPSITLNPRESSSFTVNLLPYYGIRSTGVYSVQAVIHVSGMAPFVVFG